MPNLKNQLNMSEVKYTNEQTLALMKDRHLAVTANAGSGKTSVLVEKYLDLLISDKNVRAYDAINSIVAITFTKQAAADMKAKITSKISKKMLEDKDSLKEWKSLREQISSAKVSTIHSFCNSLLRNYPVEAGISPIFREMDEYESTYYAEAAVDELLEKYSDQSNNDSSNIINEFDSLLKATGISYLRSYFLQLLKEPVVLQSLSEFYNRDTNDIVNFYKSELENILTKEIRFFGQFFIDSFNDIPPNEKNRIAIVENLYKLENELKNSKIDILEIESLFNVLKILKIGKKQSCNHFFDEECGADSTKYKNRFKVLQDHLKDLNVEDDFSHNYIDLTKSLIKFANEANVNLSKIKHELSAYTFDDLLIMALNLLLDSEVSRKITDGMKYLMVDEFQDTNQIQYDIICCLVPNLIDNLISDGPKVFIVGDAKQSIYGFRSADVKVFNKAKAAIRESNKYAISDNQIHAEPIVMGEIKTVTDQQSLGDISLADTFRLLPAVALFTNVICEKIFDEDKSGIIYEPLICGRKLVEQAEDNSTLSPRNGTISMLIAIKQSKSKSDTSGSIDNNEDNDSAEDDETTEGISSIKEEYLVAEFIKKFVSGDSEIKIYNSDTDSYENPELKDIAILTRKKSSIQKLTNVFIEKNINFSVASGKGFYQTQEVIDFLSLLNFLVNNQDDIALAGALKSPLFNISDGELLNIAQEKGSCFYEKFQNYKPENESISFFIDRAKSLFTELIDQSTLLSISELILFAIEITDYYGALAVFDAREQIKSNINHLIKTARDYESRGYKSLYEFITRSNTLNDTSSEAEAAFISGDNVISIMTIHASKGLEFPIVIIFDTNARGKSDGGLFKSKYHGISVPFKFRQQSNNSDRYFMKKTETMIHKVIKQTKSLDDLAEEARLLYVAMTRAKDHLVISATLPETKNGYNINSNTFFDLVFKSLIVSESGLASIDNFEINSELQFTGKGKLSLGLNINIWREIAYTNDLPSFSEDKHKVPKFNLEKEYYTKAIQPDSRFDIVSATKYSSFLSDIESFTERYVLGLPGILKNQIYQTKPYRDDDSDNSSVPDESEIVQKADGTEYGTLIHRIFERINEWINTAIDDNYEPLENIIKSEIELKSSLQHKATFERAYNEAKSASKSKIILKNVDNFKFSEFEKELNLPLCGSILTGSIDLLLKNEDESEIEVWDWKSNSYQSDLERLDLCHHYEPQIKFYLYLISKLHSGRDLYTGRLLFTKASSSDNWTYEIKMTSEDIANFEEELTQRIMEIKSY